MAKKSEPSKHSQRMMAKREREATMTRQAVARTETAVEKKPTLYRCIAENTVQIRALEYSRRFGPGQIVDLDEDVSNGSKLRDYVKYSCFEPIGAGGE